ncbi:MAG: hypothetical protein ACRESE_00635 [Gammaproteobacteria bacterium]
MKKLITLFILTILDALMVTPVLASSQSPQLSQDNRGMQESATNTGDLFDCSKIYGGQPASCEHIPCNKKYLSFIGTWQGEFQAYVRSMSTPDKAVYRPYHNTVRYSKSGCLENPGAGETFIVGHMTNRYPAFAGLPARVDKSLLILGRGAYDKPFMRTVDKNGINTFALVYQNTPASLSIWNLMLPAAHGNPPMSFTTIDGRDFGTPNANRRDVTVTLTVGPVDAPYWQGVIAYGSHTRE